MKNTILVMPGHLGKDTGAISPHEDTGSDTPCVAPSQERWINLQQVIGFAVAHTASCLRKHVKACIAVPTDIYARADLAGISITHGISSIASRVALANQLDADVIEIHNNAAQFNARGCEALCFSMKSNTGGISDSFRLATNTVEEISKMGLKSRGVFPSYDRDKRQYVGRNLYLLRATKNAAVITEAGFLTSGKDMGGLDVDLDGFNEFVGLCIWRGWAKTWLETCSLNETTKHHIEEDLND